MKKFIPLVALLGLSLTATGCVGDDAKKLNISENIKEFTTSVNNYSLFNDSKVSPTLNKYKLNILQANGDVFPIESVNNTDNTQNIEQNTTEEFIDNTNNREEDLDIEFDPSNDNLDEDFLFDGEENLNEEENTKQQISNDVINSIENELINDTLEIPENIDEGMAVTPLDSLSTLYHLTNDIEQYSEQYLKLKNDLEDAISETERIMAKIRSKEITLTAEQKMMITNQSQQLKQLAQQLNKTTNILNFQLSEINELLNNNDVNALPFKYYVVLNSIINGNDMLANGLATIYMINQLANANNLIASPYGRIMYGFKRNGEPVKTLEYEIIDGKLVEKSNQTDNTQNENNEEVNAKVDENQNESKLKSNIDTYQTNYHNIDSFFNTAMLDNQFMFGGNGMGAGFYGAYAPYVNNNLNPVANNNAGNNNAEQPSTKDKKKFTKNIDTYRTSATPTLSMRIKKFKDNFRRKKPKATNPIYRYSNDDSVAETEQPTNTINIK